MTNRPRSTILLCCLVLVISVGSPVSGAAAMTPSDGAPGSIAAGQTGDPMFAAEEETTTNETKHHEDPDSTSGKGSQIDIKQWLVGSMASRLNGGAVNLSQGQYQIAQSLLGDDFGRDLGRYVNVAGETDIPTDNRIGRAFNETRQTQREYVTQVQEFQETYREYQEARENGNTQRARELARDLDRLESQINATGERLINDYDSLENLTNVSFERGKQSIQAVQENITSTTTTVLDQSLVDTRLVITNATNRSAFDDPLVIKGRFVSENGTAIAGSDVTVVVPGGTPTVTTGPNGSFTLKYRPVSLRTGVQRLTVRATPNATSVYQSATTTVTTTVDPVEANLTLDSIPEQVAFGDPVTVEASVSVDGQPVANVPVNVTLGGVLLDRRLAGESGQVATAPPLPATIPSGTANLTVSIGQKGRAIEADPASQSVTVEQTATNLTIKIENGTELQVSGVLETVDGTPVSSQPVRIMVGGTLVERVQTNSAGQYSVTLGNAVVQPEQAVTITAEYNVSGSNLGSAQARATGLLSTPGEESTNNSGASSSFLWKLLTPGEEGTNNSGASSSFLWKLLLLGGGAVLLFTVGGVYLWRRRQTPTIADEPATSEDSQPDSEETIAPEQTLSDVESQLEQGRQDEAAVTLYDVVRNTFDVDTREDLTHWERYRTINESLSADEANLLEQATALYERAKFAPRSVSADQVGDLLGEANDVVSKANTPEQPADD